MEPSDNAHSSQNASLNCSTSAVSSSSSSGHPSILLAEPVILEPFNHQVGGHSSVLRFDATTLCKPLIARERKFYESKLPKELKPFIPQFRGILEVKIVDEQDGLVCLEGHKILGSAQVLDYHRNQNLSQKNSRLSPKSAASSSPSSQISPDKSSRSRSSTAAVSTSSNGENVEKPARYRFRRSGSSEIPSKPPIGSDEKSIKLTNPSAWLEEEKSIKLNSPRAKEPKHKDEEKVYKSNSSTAKDAKLEGLKWNKSNSPCGKEVAQNSFSRESRPSLASSRSQGSSLMTANTWNVKMVKAEIEKMRKKGKDANNKFKFLLQENAVHSFSCPSIIDLKMGIRQYGDDASEEKRKRFIAKTQMSTSAKLGVRLCGLQVYHVPTKKYIFVNKYKGRHFSVDGFKRVLFMFLFNGFRFRFDVVDALLAKLGELHAVVSKLKSYRFFSSSLLIGYDGHPSSSCCQDYTQSSSANAAPAPSAEPAHSDGESGILTTTTITPLILDKESSKTQQRQALATSSILNKNCPDSAALSPGPSPSSSSSSLSPSPSAQAIPNQHHSTACSDSKLTITNSSSPLVDMKMIDFAHTTTSSFADEIVYEGPDEGYMFGLENMIRILEELKGMSSDEQQQISSSFQADSSVFNVNGKS